MTFLLVSPVEPAHVWEPALRRHIPDMELRVWDCDAPDGGANVGDPADVTYILAAEPPPGVISRARFPNLKVVFGLWAGVDKMLGDTTFPRDVPYARLVDAGLKTGMAEYVTAWALYLHRDFHVLADQQQRHVWKEVFPAPETATRRIGILGLGELGRASADMLRAVGFRDIAGWSRTEKTVEGVRSFFGRDQLPAFLARTDILIMLLPLTPETDGILNADTIAHLPEGARVINAGRGRHIAINDLVAALDAGHLAHAVLDVFPEEPLPATSLLWEHPKVTVTPHTASLSVPEIAASEIAANLARFETGAPLAGLVDWDRGY